MKFPQAFAFACCSILLIVPSESTDSSEQDLLARASAQLERLAPYRRTSSDPIPSDDQWQLLDTSSKDTDKSTLDERRMALEIYRMLPEALQKDIATKGNQVVMELLSNPTYMALMQERIKRSGSKGGHGTKRDGYGYTEYEGSPEGDHPPEGYGGYGPVPYGGGAEYYGDGHPPPSGSDSGGIIKGSGSLIGGIAKGIIGGIVSASGTASKGSSSMSATSSSQGSSSSSASSSGDQKYPEYGHYGPPPHYGPPSQYGPPHSYGDKAFDVWDFKKAIVSTLMQAVKAISGGVIALKGQLIKGGGYLLSSKGKMIASSGDAITTLGTKIAKSAAKPPEPPHHNYGYDHHHEGGHGEGYDGPPPGVEEFAEPSDGYHANSNYGSPSDVDHQAGLLIAKPSKPDDHDDQSTDLDSHKPPSTDAEDNYHGPPPLDEKDVENTVLGSTENSHNQGGHSVDTHHHPSSYDVPTHQHTLDNHNKGQDYPVYPPLGVGPPAGVHSPLSIQPSVEYPPVHIRYTLPIKGTLGLPVADTSSNDLSVYGSLSIGGDPELPKLQPHTNFQSFSPLPSTYGGAALQGPLKIPLLNNPYMSPYWRGPGLHQPVAGYDMYGLYRRRNVVQRRRSVNDVLRHMRLPQV